MFPPPTLPHSPNLLVPQQYYTLTIIPSDVGVEPTFPEENAPAYNLFGDTGAQQFSEYMPGRLRSCWSEWAKLHPSRLVASIIQHGYRLQWRNDLPPPPMWHKNGRAAYEHQEFVTDKIAEVERMGIVEQCHREDLVCILAINVLPKPNSTKKRFILDGGPLKPYEVPRKFKLEQLWLQGREIFSGCTHGSVIDLSNAFYHIDMDENSKKYIGFEWLEKFYRYNSLPQGIHSAPFIFTAVTKPMVKHWRFKGIRVLPYFDDFPSAARDMLSQRLHIAYMREHLISLGWLLQDTKLIGYPDPVTTIPALGSLISFADQKYFLAPAKVTQIQQLAAEFLPCRRVFVRKLSKLAGLIISRTHCLGPAARIHTRSMYTNIEERLQPHERLLPQHGLLGWNRSINLRFDTRAELEFWIDQINHVNGQPFQRCSHVRVIEVDQLVDAGKNGWGGVLYLPPGSALEGSALLHAAQRALPSTMTITAIASAIHDGIRVTGTFTPDEMQEGSNVRELLANLRMLESLVTFVADMRVDQRMDNSGAVKALGGIIPATPELIFGGSNNPRIQGLVLAIETFCIRHNIDRRTFWVPRSINNVADYMSKVCHGDHYSYMVRPHLRDYIQRQFGTPTVDRFASRNNIQVPSGRYNSKFFEAEAEWLNAFSCDWKYNAAGCPEHNWVHPPYTLLGRACQHLHSCHANATLILPFWPAASWWPDVAPLIAPHPQLNLGFCSEALVYPQFSGHDPIHLPRGRLLAVRFFVDNLPATS